jgi:hypothetical protein
MKKIFVLLFIAGSVVCYSQTWTERFNKFDNEYTVISKEQYQSLLQENEGKYKYCALSFVDVSDKDNSPDVISGSRPKLDGYYYLTLKSKPRLDKTNEAERNKMNLILSSLVYGHSNTGEMRLDFGSSIFMQDIIGAINIKTLEKSYSEKYNQYIFWVNKFEKGKEHEKLNVESKTKGIAKAGTGTGAGTRTETKKTDETKKSEATGYINITIPTADIFPKFDNIKYEELEMKLARSLDYDKNPYTYSKYWGRRDYLLTGYPDQKSVTIFKFLQLGKNKDNSLLLNLSYYYNLTKLNISDKQDFLAYTVDMLNKTYNVNAKYIDNEWYFWDNVIYWGVYLRLINVAGHDFLEVKVPLQSMR